MFGLAIFEYHLSWKHQFLKNSIQLMIFQAIFIINIMIDEHQCRLWMDLLWNFNVTLN